ncbi:MAG: biopolymer transporter ExbD [Pirellulaceae bacterium]|nr:MAG: biopolymer transporter ExbD [Pirellulaceae bacterium]
MTVQLNKGQAFAALNLTPLIDVVFLLLIFFLVASRFAEEDRQLEVALPQASEARPLLDQPRDFVVNIDEQGRYFVNETVMTLEEVDQALRQAIANNPLTQSVNIRADKRVDFQYVLQILNLCKRYDVKSYTFDTE